MGIPGVGSGGEWKGGLDSGVSPKFSQQSLVLIQEFHYAPELAIRPVPAHVTVDLFWADVCWIGWVSEVPEALVCWLAQCLRLPWRTALLAI